VEDAEDEAEQGGDKPAGEPYSITFPSQPFQYQLGKPFDLEEVREKTRRNLALILAALLFIVAILLVSLTATGDLKVETTKDLAASVLSPVVAVTGTALGFYFGGHRGGKGGD
jgi:hypothetical protein